jgi:hypothetical protein
MLRSTALERALLDARQAAKRPATAGTEAEHEDQLSKLIEDVYSGSKRKQAQEDLLTKKQMAIKESEEENRHAKEWNVEREVVKDNSKA